MRINRARVTPRGPHNHGAKHPNVVQGKEHPSTTGSVSPVNGGKKKSAAERLYPAKDY